MSGGSSKSRSKSKSVSRSSGESASRTGVWDDQAQYLNQLYAGGREDLAAGREYGDDRYAGLGAEGRGAIRSGFGTFGRGEANIDAASQQFQDTMGGRYLDPESNPYLQAQYDVGARGIKRDFLESTQALGSRMEASGRSGSGANRFRQDRNEEALATGLGDFSARLYGENYGRERGIQAGMAGQAGQISGAGWQNVGGLTAAGDREQMNRQRELDDRNARFQFSQDARGEDLARFRDLLGGPTMTSEATSREEAFSRAKSKSRGKTAQGGI